MSTKNLVIEQGSPTQIRSATMGRFFKGSSPGSFYSRPENDPKVQGLQARPISLPGHDAIVRHITNYSNQSPYVSLTTSFAVARAYALAGGRRGPASKANPGIIWEIDIPDDNKVPLTYPAQVLATNSSANLLHDGEQDLLSKLALRQAHLPAKIKPNPDALQEFQVNWKVPSELLALIYAIRDAEVFAERVPAVCVINRHDVW